MIEPTDEQVAAFKAAWEAESHRTYSHPGERYEPGDRTRAGLRAMFALPQSLPGDDVIAMSLADRTIWSEAQWRQWIAIGANAAQHGVDILKMLEGVARIPHVFAGQLVRGCEICGLPDRASIHAVRHQPHRFIPFDDRVDPSCDICGTPRDALPNWIWESLPSEPTEGA